jgi:predicted DCC family thiol-disulfide oxidoreductase YuxK
MPTQLAEAQESRIDATLREADAIIFYDGVCGLCDAFIQFTLPRDKARRLRYGMQQGEAFAQVSALYPELGDLSTMVLAERVGPALAGGGQDWRGGWRYSKFSTAALRSLGRLGGLWGLARVFLIVPPVIRNAVYKFIARNRYKWFGKHDACRLPTPEERALFLP